MSKNAVPTARAYGRALAHRRHAKSFVLLAVVAVAVGLIGSSAATGATSAKPTLTIAGSSYCQRFSPILANTDHTSRISDMYLIHFNGFSKPYTPGSASSWKVTDQNKVITFTLRKDLKFSDGTPFDAQAVKTWLDWRVQQASAAFSTLVGPIKSVDVVSKYVVRLTLKSPNPEIAYAFGEYGFTWGDIQSPKAVAAAATDSNIWVKGTYGLGPYMLDPSQSVVGDHCTYVPNPYYPGAAKLKWGTVVSKYIIDPNTLLAAAQSGQIDVGVASTGAIVPAAQSAGLTILHAKSLLVSMYIVDHGAINPALADVRVRQALNYALDRKAIVNVVYPGSGFATSSPSPIVAGNSPTYDNYYAYNPAKAKSLLAASGHAGGLTLKVLTAQGGFGLGVEQVAQLACKYWGEVGVNCDLTDQPLASWFGQVASNKYSISAGVVAPSPIWSWFTQSMVPAPSSTSGADQHGWFDPVVKSLWLKGERLPGNAGLPYWQKIIKRAVENADTVPVAIPGAVLLVSKSVSGVTVNSPVSLDVSAWSPSGK